MTKRRLYTLVGGVAVLASISWWRLTGDEPPLPSRPEAPPAFRQPSESDVGPKDRAAVEGFSGETMGTTYTVKYVPPRPGIEQILKTATEAALLAVNASMSTYDPESEISGINDSRLDVPLPLSQELLEVLTLASRIHDESDGAFDVTVGPLVFAYGFGPQKDGAVPDAATLEEIGRSVGMQLLELDTKNKTLRKLSPNTVIDLGGIAKGYGVDQVAKALEKLGVESYMIEVGGEIRVRGRKPGGEPWVLAIEEPTPGQRRVHGTLSLPDEGAALATSGDYRNFRKVGNRLVSHTFDPRAKRPVPRRTASVSVVMPTAAEADAWATAMTVLPPEQALRIASSKQMPLYLLTHDEAGGFTVHQSEAWKKLGMKTP